MEITFGAKARITRCIRNFRPLPVTSVYADSNCTRYVVKSSDGNIIGGFTFDTFDGQGVLANLMLFKESRRQKAASDAFFSIEKFLLNKAKKEHLDFIEVGVKDNRRNSSIKKLCEKLNFKEAGLMNGIHKFVRVINPNKEADILEKIRKTCKEPPKISVYV